MPDPRPFAPPPDPTVGDTETLIDLGILPDDPPSDPAPPDPEPGSADAPA
jgi:hypothetical protein